MRRGISFKKDGQGQPPKVPIKRAGIAFADDQPTRGVEWELEELQEGSPGASPRRNTGGPDGSRPATSRRSATQHGWGVDGQDADGADVRTWSGATRSPSGQPHRRRDTGNTVNTWSSSDVVGSRLPTRGTGSALSSRPMTMQQMSKVLEARQFAQRVQDSLDKDFMQGLEWDSAIKIQAWYRMIRYSRIGPLALVFRKNERKRQAAAVQMQRVYRGHLGRHHPDLELRIEIRRLEHCCAILIQSVTRAHQKRVLFRSMVDNQRATRMLVAVVRVQKMVRGWVERRAQEHERSVLVARLRAIEGFHEKYFKPWQKAQHKLLQENLQRLVHVQSKVRRYLALKHARERRKTMHDYAALGVWLLLYLLVLVLMLVATINERDNGAVSDFRLAADTHLLPPPLSFSAGTRHASRVLAEAAGLHAAAAAVRAANSSASSAASGAGKRRTVADGGDGKGSAEFAAGTADSSRADRRQATPSPSAPLSTPVPDTTPPPAQGAAVAAATASVQRRNSAPSAAQISQPQHVWSWLEHLLLPQARLVGQTSECSRATANQRLCAAPPARPPPPGAEGAFYQDGFPGVVMAPLHVRQHRAPRRRWRLPFAGTQEMYDRCLFTKLGAGHVCLNAPEGFNSGLWESPAYGHAQVLQADSFEEYLAKSHNYTRFAYSPARGALDAAAAFMPPFGAWLLFGSGSRDMFGSTYVNFTASGSDGRTGVTFGELAYYPDGGFDLGEAAAIPATPVSGQLYAEQRLNILDPAATACGVPCEGGLRGLALAEWLDSASRSIVLTMSAFSPARNALVCIKALVEFGAGGGAVVSRQVGASRLLSYGGGGLPDGSSEFQTSARLVPEVLWLLCGLVHLALTMVLALYHVHFERIVPKREAAQGAAQARKKKGGYRMRMVKREGKFGHRVKHAFLSGWGALDLATGVLVVLGALARGSAQVLASAMAGKLAAASADGGGGRRQQGGLGGVATFSDSELLVWLHGLGDGCVALVAAALWGRGVFKYLPTVRWMQAPVVAVARLAQPLLAMGLVSFCVVAGTSHLGLLLFGPHVRRFGSFQSAMGCVVGEMLNIHSLVPADEAPLFLDARVSRGRGQWVSWREVRSKEGAAAITRGGGAGGVVGRRRAQGAGMDGWGGEAWSVRGGGEGGWFVDCVRLFGLVVGSWAAAAAVNALQEELRRAFHGSSRPWLYEGVRRTDFYKSWHVPPLLELYKMVRDFLRSEEAEQAALQKSIVQMRVLTHIRGQARQHSKVPFKWAIELDEDTAAKEEKIARTELKKVSRRLALQKRSFAARCEQLELKMEEISEHMMDGLDLLFESDFVHQTLVWPRAQLDFSSLAAATKAVAAEEEADRKKVLKIPMRRMQTMDKQVGMAERLLADLLLFVQQEDQALRAKTQARAKATEKGMTFADREAIYKTM